METLSMYLSITDSFWSGLILILESFFFFWELVPHYQVEAAGLIAIVGWVSHKTISE